jgi:hypothetical protein
MIIVRILGWREQRAWTDQGGVQRTALERRLLRLMSLDRTSIKRLVRQVLADECRELRLDKASDRFAAESTRSFLESLGAVAVVESVALE